MNSNSTKIYLILSILLHILWKEWEILELLLAQWRRTLLDWVTKPGNMVILKAVIVRFDTLLKKIVNPNSITEAVIDMYTRFFFGLVPTLSAVFFL